MVEATSDIWGEFCGKILNENLLGQILTLSYKPLRKMDFLLSLRLNDYQLVVVGWNIILSLLPCLIVYKMSQMYPHKKWATLGLMGQISFLGLFLIWFFFFPNTAYLIADIRHLVDYCEHPGFLRICKDQAYIVPIFFTYALIGVPTFYYALRQMTRVLRMLFNKTVSRLFPLFMIPLTSLGVMLGLVARFNSWDIVRSPFAIIHTVFKHLGEPVMLLNIVSYTVMLYLIYYFILFIKKSSV